MAKGPKSEYVWMECTECGERNYRTPVALVKAGTNQPMKLELKKYCSRDHKHTLHKMKKK